MREFKGHETTALMTGLRPSSRGSRYTQHLYEATNVQLDDFGLQGYSAVTQAIDPAPTISFPFPQLFRFKRRTFLLEQTAINSVDEVSFPWSSNSLTTYDPDTPANTKAITGSGVWHGADFGDSYFFTNGTSVVFLLGVEKLHGNSEKVFVQNSVTVNTLCTHKGRLVAAGFDSSNFWNSTFDSIFSTWRSALTESADFQFPVDEIGEAWLFYSSIGGGDFLPWLFYPSGYSYDIGPDAGKLLEAFEENHVGFLPMPYQGIVQVVKPLGDHLIAYGEDGIAAFTPFANQYAVGYGLSRHLKVGVDGRSAVGGDDERHFFIDKSGSLWTVGGDLSFQQLGYEEFFFPYLGGDMAIVSSDKEDRTYFSDGTDHYLWKNGGLTKHDQALTSVVFQEGGEVGVVDSLSGSEALVTTGVLDMNIAGLKTLTWVELGYEDGGTVSVALDYRYGQNAFARSDFVEINEDGFARLQITAREFRIVVKATDHENFELDYIQYAWQPTDKRTIRGPYGEIPSPGQLRAGQTDS